MTTPAIAGGDAAGRRPARRGLRLLAAASTGLALVLAFPGPDLGPVAFVALVPLLLAAERVRPGRAAALGLVAGLVFFTVHLWWINVFGYLALGALSLAQAGFLAGFAALVPATRRLGGWRLLALPACWATLELLRAHAPLGGFPWGILGLSQHGGGPLLPLARVVGVYGLSAVIVAVNVAVAQAVRSFPGGADRLTGGAARSSGGTDGLTGGAESAPPDPPDGSSPAQPAARRRWWPAAGWLAVAVALPFAGLAAPAPPPADGPAVDLVAVQGNVPGVVRGDRPDQAQADAVTFTNHLRATLALAGGPAPALVVWGEGAANDDPPRNPVLADGIRRAAAAARSPLLVGASTESDAGSWDTEALLYDRDGRLVDRYAKRRLVPFGEYVPGGRVLRRLVPATDQLGVDKRPGHRLAPMTVDGVRFGTIVCWESAYAEDARQLARDGARFLVVITNNSSWGIGPGSAQHLATSQLRAVEEGRTVVHTAISGISAVIGPDGVARQRTGLYEQATVRTAVAPRSGLTFYARFGRLFEWYLVAMALASLAVSALLGLGVRRTAAGAGPLQPRPQHAVSRGGP
ncbi:MAG TPA: apolipoprotein N-acyltransferase [Actinomycetota bacterium]